MTKYRTATYIGLTPMTFLWGVTQVTDYLTRMHTAHLANVSKSVTKNATFPRTGGLPCLITHSCMSATSPTVVGGLIFCISATPHPGSLFPLFHGTTADHGLQHPRDVHLHLYIHMPIVHCLLRRIIQRRVGQFLPVWKY